MTKCLHSSGQYVDKSILFVKMFHWVIQGLQPSRGGLILTTRLIFLQMHVTVTFGLKNLDVGVIRIFVEVLNLEEMFPKY